MSVHLKARWISCLSQGHTVTRSLVTCLIGCPQGQVVTEQLHDEGGVLVRVLSNIVELCNRIFECCSSHLASLLWIIEHLVLKDGVVQCQAKTDRVCHSQVFLCNLLCLLICHASILCGFSLVVTICVLCLVAVVIGLHLLVEDLRLAIACLGNEVSIQQPQDCAADFRKLFFHFAAILLGKGSIAIVALGLFLLLHTADDAPSCTAAPHSILVGHRQEVTLFDRQLVRLLPHDLHFVSHLIIAFGLLCELCEVHFLITANHLHGTEAGNQKVLIGLLTSSFPATWNKR